MLNYRLTKGWKSAPVRHAYGAKDTILYALGIGAGEDPAELHFVYEKRLAAIPSMAAVLAWPGPLREVVGDCGIDFLKVVHGEQGIRLHAPLPACATLIGTSEITRVVDNGQGRGAVVHMTRELRDAASMERVATVEQSLFCRADGGFSASDGLADEAPAARPALPDTAPDAVFDMPTRADMALLYRLSADMNPLHVDADAARAAGFPRPILHGLATYGVTCRALLRGYCADAPGRLRSFGARMSAPVFPGETVRVECWRVGEGIAFRSRVPERNATVMTQGWAELSAERPS